MAHLHERVRAKLFASGASKIQLVGQVGQTLMEVCRDAGIMEGACDGNCQCSTCHVFIPEASDRLRLGMPDCVPDFEQDAKLPD